MEILKDAVIINLSPPQRQIVRDPAFASCFIGISLDAHGSRRPRIPVSEIAGLVSRLRELKTTVGSNPVYQQGDPEKVIDQIILKLEDAAAAQRRVHPAT
jgi:hypothetical protein